MMGSRCRRAAAPCNRFMPRYMRQTEPSSLRGDLKPNSTCVVATACRYTRSVANVSFCALWAIHRHSVSCDTGNAKCEPCCLQNCSKLFTADLYELRVLGASAFARMLRARSTSRGWVVANTWLAKGRAADATPENGLSVHATINQQTHFRRLQQTRLANQCHSLRT